MKQETLLQTAFAFVDVGFSAFPLSPLTKVPLKGSRGFKEATKEKSVLAAAFNATPWANVGLALEGTDYFVVDCDRHGDVDGIQSFLTLSAGQKAAENTVTVRTPNNGLHFYFRRPQGVTVQHVIGFRPGVDILTTWVMAPGSRIRREDGSTGIYTLTTGKLADIPTAPLWLVQALQESQSRQKPGKTQIGAFYSGTGRQKKFTAALLEEIAEGVDEPGRNDWLTRQTGRLFSLGMDPQSIYKWLFLMNDSFINPPLPDAEVNAIFRSILNREMKKGGA